MIKGLKSCLKCNGRGYRQINGTIEDCYCQEIVKAIAGRLANIDHEIACLYHANPRLHSWIVESKQASLKAEASVLREKLY